MFWFKHLVSYYEERKKHIDDKLHSTQVNILPNNENNFKSFTVGKLSFIDSFAHLPSGLESLINNVPDDKKHFIRSLCNNDEEFELRKKKGFFPYDWFDNIDKLNMPIEELKIHHFDNSMRKEKLSYDDWLSVQYVIEKLDMKTFKDYHDYYLDTDVAGCT